MLSTSHTGLAHVCYLVVKARPEHTIASMVEGELLAPMGCMEFV